MVSPQSILVGAFIVLLSLPLLVFPEKSARIRHRHATNPRPTDSAIREARLAGGLIFLTGILVLLAY